MLKPDKLQRAKSVTASAGFRRTSDGDSTAAQRLREILQDKPKISPATPAQGESR
ncbi:MAG: hypothetical protein KDA84_24225 [Planctomycetaceae bacterium]|nr:hypothetical protein [Planctomycetaceae bacterium]